MNLSGREMRGVRALRVDVWRAAGPASLKKTVDRSGAFELLPDWHILLDSIFIIFGHPSSSVFTRLHPSPLNSSPNSDHRAFTASDIARTRDMIRSPSSPPTILPPYLAANLSGCQRSSILRNLDFVAVAGTANHGASNDALDVPSPTRSELPGGQGTSPYPTGRSDASSVAHASSWR